MERLNPTGTAVATSTPDWPARTADTIEAVVTTARDKSVRPLTLVAKAAVYGIIVGIVGATVIIVGTIGIVRVMNIYALPDWLSLIVVGGSLTLAGLLIMTRAWAAART